MKECASRRGASLAMVVFGTIAACGGDQAQPAPPPAATAAPTADETPKAEAPAASGSATAGESPRQKAVRLTLKAIDDPEMDPVKDAGQRARIASMGLSEGGFGLPRGQLRAFEAVVGESVDPSQCARILGQALEETAKPIVEKRCGSMEALLKKVSAVAAPAKAKTLMASCKITEIEAKDPSKLNPWAVLASVVVLDELAADPESSADEKKIARAIVSLCPIQ
jgi:hypothetical protein